MKPLYPSGQSTVSGGTRSGFQSARQEVESSSSRPRNADCEDLIIIERRQEEDNNMSVGCCCGCFSPALAVVVRVAAVVLMSSRGNFDACNKRPQSGLCDCHQFGAVQLQENKCRNVLATL